jgi:hypothetical protein
MWSWQLTSGITFPLFACIHFWFHEFYEGGTRGRRLPMKWSATAESLRNTDLILHLKYSIT